MENAFKDIEKAEPEIIKAVKTIISNPDCAIEEKAEWTKMYARNIAQKATDSTCV